MARVWSVADCETLAGGMMADDGDGEGETAGDGDGVAGGGASGVTVTAGDSVAAAALCDWRLKP